MNEYENWLASVTDPELKKELLNYAGNKDGINDAFYKHLSFGTGGLRGKLGAGTNRMNVYTVKRASMGLSKHLKKSQGKSIAIGYDTRLKSHDFAVASAEVFSNYGIDSYLFSAPLPTPLLSFAVRQLKCDLGVMITASHNPSCYNGYKVYGSDGCQITDSVAKSILEEINSSGYFENTVGKDKEQKGKVHIIDDKLYNDFLTEVSGRSVLFGEECNKSLKIVYTPLNGTGYKPVTDILKLNGYKNVTEVKEQTVPDGNFPTCKYPNPELTEAYNLGIEYARRVEADILIATDPDCDRVGTMVKHKDEYVHLSGNEVGLLLLDYVLSQRKKHARLCENAVCLKTIVTSPLAEKIAESYGVKIKSLLTGFKYIGEEIGRLEVCGRKDDFVFGFEESCGYLGGDYVRDKDGVYGALILSEMTAYYSGKGKSLIDKLEELYRIHGYCESKLISYTFEGQDGANKILSIMKNFRESLNAVANMSLLQKTDYSESVDGLPKSDVIKLELEGGHTVIVRPSGTEPKIKFYVFAYGENKKEAEMNLNEIITAKELSY